MVVVPGVYDKMSTSKDDYSHPEVSPWIREFMNWLPSDSRIMYYRYQSHRLFSGRRCREAIRDCAEQLLRSLAMERSSIESQVKTCLPCLEI